MEHLRTASRLSETAEGKHAQNSSTKSGTSDDEHTTSASEPGMTDGDRLKIYSHGCVDKFDPIDFPDGAIYLDALKKHNVSLLVGQDSALYWQACARWTLLRRFGLWRDEKYGLKPPNISYHKSKEGRFNLVLSQEAIQFIANTWMTAVETTKSPPDTCTNDLLEFLERHTSNGRTLQFASMRIAPGYELHAHAHPNIELAFVGEGVLHEVLVPTSDSQGDNQQQRQELTQFDHEGLLHGPALSLVGPEEIWTVHSLEAGQWLVNSVGSIHKTFTSSGQGCLLILLFGGAEANVSDEEEHAHAFHKAMLTVEQPSNPAGEKMAQW